MSATKHFLTGLHPTPPPGYIWQDWQEYSLYLADQRRSTWHEHTHDCTQLTIALEPANVSAAWRDFPGRTSKRELQGDMIWLVPPGVSHSVLFNRRAPLTHFYFSDEFFEKVTHSDFAGISSRLRPSLLVRDSFLIELVKDVGEELKFGPLSELYSQSVATLVASHLVRRYSNKANAVQIFRGGLGPSREKRIRQYIQDNLSSKLALDELAQVAELSPNHFASLFRQTTGTTPHKFVMQQRVEHARHLLEHSKLPLIDIAARCGFQDQSQFTTTFRRHVGVSPGRYKREL